MANLAGVSDDPTLTPGAPVFGRRETPLDERTYRRFGLEVETTGDRWDEFFEAYLDVDGGSVLTLMNSRTDMQQANATAMLLHTSLRDDDGVPSDWLPPVEPELVDPDDPESDWLRTEPTDEQPEGEPLYRDWDGELRVKGELRELDDLAEGSSLRRFAFIMDSTHHRVKMEALNQIAEWIIGDLAKRPTQQPRPSGRGQSRTARTSGARRR
jgi:hypothetical protein